MGALRKYCRIETVVQADVPPLIADNGVAESMVRDALQSDDEAITVPFGTEGGQFQHAGWSTVVCGPGSIEQAHKPNEFIEPAQVKE